MKTRGVQFLIVPLSWPSTWPFGLKINHNHFLALNNEINKNEAEIKICLGSLEKALSVDTLLQLYGLFIRDLQIVVTKS